MKRNLDNRAAPSSSVYAREKDQIQDRDARYQQVVDSLPRIPPKACPPTRIPGHSDDQNRAYQAALSALPAIRPRDDRSTYKAREYASASRNKADTLLRQQERRQREQRGQNDVELARSGNKPAELINLRRKPDAEQLLWKDRDLSARKNIPDPGLPKIRKTLTNIETTGKQQLAVSDQPLVNTNKESTDDKMMRVERNLVKLDRVTSKSKNTPTAERKSGLTKPENTVIVNTPMAGTTTNLCMTPTGPVLVTVTPVQVVGQGQFATPGSIALGAMAPSTVVQRPALQTAGSPVTASKGPVLLAEMAPTAADLGSASRAPVATATGGQAAAASFAIAEAATTDGVSTTGGVTPKVPPIPHRQPAPMSDIVRAKQKKKVDEGVRRVLAGANLTTTAKVLGIARTTLRDNVRRAKEKELPQVELPKQIEALLEEQEPRVEEEAAEDSSNKCNEEDCGTLGDKANYALASPKEKLRIKTAAVNMVLMGSTSKQAYEHYGIPKRTMNLWVRRAKMEAGTLTNDYTNSETLEQAVQMALGGVSVKDTAEHFGLCYETVRGRVRAAKIRAGMPVCPTPYSQLTSATQVQEPFDDDEDDGDDNAIPTNEKVCYSEQPPDTRVKLKAAAIRMVLSGSTSKEVAEHYGVSPRSINMWVRESRLQAGTLTNDCTNSEAMKQAVDMALWGVSIKETAEDFGLCYESLRRRVRPAKMKAGKPVLRTPGTKPPAAPNNPAPDVGNLPEIQRPTHSYEKTGQMSMEAMATPISEDTTPGAASEMVSGPAGNTFNANMTASGIPCDLLREALNESRVFLEPAIVEDGLSSVSNQFVTTTTTKASSTTTTTSSTTWTAKSQPIDDLMSRLLDDENDFEKGPQAFDNALGSLMEGSVEPPQTNSRHWNSNPDYGIQAPVQTGPSYQGSQSPSHHHTSAWDSQLMGNQALDQSDAGWQVPADGLLEFLEDNQPPAQNQFDDLLSEWEGGFTNSANPDWF